jgi:hypothetical protein
LKQFQVGDVGFSTDNNLITHLNFLVSQSPLKDKISNLIFPLLSFQDIMKIEELINKIKEGMVISTCYAYFFPAGSKFISWRFSNKSPEFRKTLLDAFERVCAISLEASIFLRVINAGLLAIAWPISCALLASPCNRWETKLNKIDLQMGSKSA